MVIVMSIVKKVSKGELYSDGVVCTCDFIHNYNLSNIDRNSTLVFEASMCSCFNNVTDPQIYSANKNHISDCNIDPNYRFEVILACLTASAFLLVIVYITYLYLYNNYKYDIQYRYLLLKRMLGLTDLYRASKISCLHRGYEYDAFVSYSVDDSNFVQKMMTILETEGSKFKLCLFERDFRPGDDLINKILECMQGSVATILVLSESFAKSDWCRWELSIASNTAIFQRFNKDSLIIIMKSKIKESLMTPTLYYLLKSRVYLEWNEHSSVRQKIFWEKLKETLKKSTQSQEKESQQSHHP